MVGDLVEVVVVGRAGLTIPRRRILERNRTVRKDGGRVSGVDLLVVRRRHIWLALGGIGMRRLRVMDGMMGAPGLVVVTITATMAAPGDPAGRGLEDQVRLVRARGMRVPGLVGRAGGEGIHDSRR